MPHKMFIDSGAAENPSTSAEELPPWFLERQNITQRPPGKAVHGACVLQPVWMECFSALLGSLDVTRPDHVAISTSSAKSALFLS